MAHIKGKKKPPDIEVMCTKCGVKIDEEKVDLLGISEDRQGRDVLAFICPYCKETQKSLRFR